MLVTAQFYGKAVAFYIQYTFSSFFGKGIVFSILVLSGHKEIV